MTSAHQIGKSIDTPVRETGGLAPLEIDGLRLAGNALLAPMSGVTDAPFRRLAHRFGATLVVSEMVASEELVKAMPDAVLRTEGQGVSPHVIQLAGCEAKWMAEGARRAVAAGADIVDINMGCPARRVTSGWSGSALMRDLDNAARLIEATVSAVEVPVTLKMRLGWDRASINAPELARRAVGLGVHMITVHARTRCDFYKGPVDWPAVRPVVEAVDVPVIINGDINSLADVREALAQSGAAGVMIGRGAGGRPWSVGAIARALSGDEASDGPASEFTPPAPLAGLVAEHYDAMLSHYGTGLGLRIARKHLSWYLDHWVAPDARAGWRKALLTETDAGRVAAGIPAAFAGESAMEAAA